MKRGLRLGRRPLLAAGLALGAGGTLAGCAAGTDPRERTPSGLVAPERLDYGPGVSQFAELYRPERGSRGVVVVVHGGFWRARYGLSLGRPLARSLLEEGWTAYNIEYRRVGLGGGWPETFDDVAAAIDALADVDDLDLSTVLTLGHSAGGHLAVWAAARGRFDRWRPERVRVTGCVSQAGVLDLTRAARDGLGGGAVTQFLGRPPGPAYDRVDPARQVPLDVPVRCVHGEDDVIVPPDQSQGYVDAATAAGDDASLTLVEGDHFTLNDPATDAWRRTVGLLDSLRS